MSNNNLKAPTKISAQQACERYPESMGVWIETYHNNSNVKYHFYERDGKIGIDVEELDDSLWPYVWDPATKYWVAEKTLND